MDFKKATDLLMSGMTRAELAEALGCSEAAVRQAKLAEAAKAYRRPPPGWEAVLKRLAEKRAAQLLKLAAQLSA